MRGFTLPELIIVIVILGIVSATAGIVIRGPVDAYVDQVRRAALVDSAEMALRRVAIDVRRALPNSVRVAANTPGCAAGQCLEMLNALNGARYRDQPAAGPGGGNTDKRLRFNGTDEAFNVQGPFTPLTSSTAHWLVIYNLGSGDANAYEVGSPDADYHVITETGTEISIAPDAGLFAGEYSVTLDPPHRFRHESPGKRIYLVDGPIMYRCTGGDLLRYEGYGINADVTAPGAGAQLVARHVTNCDFGYDAGTSTRAGLVTMTLTLSKDGESVTLLHQVHVENSP